MKVKIYASGSAGNCVIIEDELIIDAGVEVLTRGSLLLLTHSHTDHTKMLHKYAGLPVYTTRETAEKLRDRFPYIEFNILEFGTYALDTPKGKFLVTPVRLKHDVPCVGFDICYNGERILYATDFNEILDDIYVRDYTALYLECNNTLLSSDMVDVYFNDTPPKDGFHRRKSYSNHCNVAYLVNMFTRAGFSPENRCETPLVLLHKSSYYYASHVERLVPLCRIANVRNPLFGGSFLSPDGTDFCNDEERKLAMELFGIDNAQ